MSGRDPRFTPGPWTLAEKRIDGRFIVECPTYFPHVQGQVAQLGYRPNAVLVALAPEMAELVNYIGGHSPDDKIDYQLISRAKDIMRRLMAGKP